MQALRRYAVLLIVPVIYGIDWWTKRLIIENIPYGQGTEVTGFFNIVHARNLGGVFGFLANYPQAKLIFSFLPLLVVAVLVFILLRYALPFSKRLALSSILGGAMGNIHDRLVYGYVTDFLDFHVFGYHWYAFNVADIAVSFGVGLWIYTELFLAGKSPEARSQSTG